VRALVDVVSSNKTIKITDVSDRDGVEMATGKALFVSLNTILVIVGCAPIDDIQFEMDVDRDVALARALEHSHI
jgi:hypothetical protein